MNDYQVKVTLLYTKWYLMPFFSLTTSLKNAVKVNNFHKYSKPEICKYDEKKTCGSYRHQLSRDGSTSHENNYVQIPFNLNNLINLTGNSQTKKPFISGEEL